MKPRLEDIMDVWIVREEHGWSVFYHDRQRRDELLLIDKQTLQEAGVICQQWYDSETLPEGLTQPEAVEVEAPALATARKVSGVWSITTAQSERLISAYLAASTQFTGGSEAKPVAWRVNLPNGNITMLPTLAAQWREQGADVQPLYTSPPGGSEAASAEQILQFMRERGVTKITWGEIAGVAEPDSIDLHAYRVAHLSYPDAAPFDDAFLGDGESVHVLPGEAPPKAVGVKADDKSRKQFKLWFFRDVPEDIRLKLFGLMMYGIAARELETHAAQASALTFCLDAIAPLPPEGTAARDAVIEECAKVADRLTDAFLQDDHPRASSVCDAVAKAIRALRSIPEAP